MKNLDIQTHLTIGSTESNASTRIVPFLLQLHNNFPNMNLELVTNTTRDITKELLDYKVDIAFISGELLRRMNLATQTHKHLAS